jgi:hypothetical protein
VVYRGITVIKNPIKAFVNTPNNSPKPWMISKSKVPIPNKKNKVHPIEIRAKRRAELKKS